MLEEASNIRGNRKNNYKKIITYNGLIQVKASHSIGSVNRIRENWMTYRPVEFEWLALHTSKASQFFINIKMCKLVLLILLIFIEYMQIIIINTWFLKPFQTIWYSMVIKFTIPGWNNKATIKRKNINPVPKLRKCLYFPEKWIHFKNLYHCENEANQFFKMQIEGKCLYFEIFWSVYWIIPILTFCIKS